jgi:hypothetical protein
MPDKSLGLTVAFKSLTHLQALKDADAKLEFEKEVIYFKLNFSCSIKLENY